MRSLLDRASAIIARIALRLFFRRVETVGAERTPATDPLLVVANHGNGLIDPVLLLGALPRRVRFLGKSTLWKNPALRPFLALGGVIPVYRRHDPGVDASRNQEMFSRTHQELAHGGAIAMFPEGISHDRPKLQPLKTGAARIALGTLRTMSKSGIKPNLKVLPVGLEFDARQRFRSRALLWVGAPIDPAATDLPFDEENREAVHQLTEAIDEGLRSVTTNFQSWREARLIDQAVDLYRRPFAGQSTRPSLAQEAQLRRELVEGYRGLQQSLPDETARLVDAIGRYDRVLSSLALRDDQIANRYSIASVGRFLGRTLATLGIALPAAILGVLLNAIPYQIIAWVAQSIGRSLDQQATYKLFGSVFLYPLAWLLQATIIGLAVGSGWALAACLGAPILGFAALLFLENRNRLWRESRAFILLRTRPRLARELRLRRAAIVDQVLALAEHWRLSAEEAATSTVS